MSKNINFVSHKKSKVKNNGKPQLPSPSALVEGEIAINYAEDVETLSIKNESGTVVTFSSDNYYTEQKLGSGFTGANSANTVTKVIEDNEIAIAAAINDLNENKLDASAYTPTDLSNYYTKDEIDDKLGSGFTGENSANTVTSVLEENERTVSETLNNFKTRLDSFSGKAVTDIISSDNSISATTVQTVDGIKADLTTNASKISGLTAVANSDEGAAKVSGVSATDTVQVGIKNLYDSLKSEIAARKSAILARKFSGDSAIQVTETPNADGFGTTISLKLDAATQGNGSEKTGVDNALTVTNNGLFLSSSWECGTFE